MSGYDVYGFVHEETRNAAISRKNETAGSCSSVVEHSLGKGEVVRSIRIKSTNIDFGQKYNPTVDRIQRFNTDWQSQSVLKVKPKRSIHC